MRKILQYIMLAVVTIVMASCTSDIEETTATTGKNNVQLVVGEFPAFGDSQTRAIGTPDEGKTSWAEGDELLLEIDNTSYGRHNATFTYNGSSWKLTSGELVYLEGDPAYISHVYYAPNYKWEAGKLVLKEGKDPGTDEYIEGNAIITGNGETITVSFAEATRKYSRLRIATLPNEQITVDTEYFTPAGSSDMEQNGNYTLTSDEKGNAYLYGTFENNSEVTVKYREAALTTYTFSQATESAKSYALDATVISANSAEEIKSAIEQKVADGKTTIRLNLAPNAGTDEFMAIREAIKGAAPNDLGTIELTIIGVETIPEEAFYKMLQLKSVKMSDVKEIKKYAFKECKYLTVVEAPSLNKLCSGAFKKCDQLSKLTFGPINYADERNWPIFEYITPSIDLILSDYQKEMIETDDYLYTANNDRDYAGSYEHNSKNFLGREFKSITCRYRVE
ncbi:leucine-rich repeat protein [Bacteroides xylanisolvens]|uniref:leucine-rich repeat protein n=1 Tax=Bacteroides xylanisolvens TaxID=371601 RepID=UPI001CDB646E|nr:leucine-rich repeat protein [Bacteroides xylanisolvens]MCA4677456.1 leucine-rich repeat domain-containing protein [Bacteroides xylanisolvens]